jgi:hypothetical protein
LLIKELKKIIVTVFSGGPRQEVRAIGFEFELISVHLWKRPPSSLPYINSA